MLKTTPARSAASPPALCIAPIASIIDEIRNGRFVVLVERAAVDARCCLVGPAQMVTPDAVNFMARHARGVICVALEERRISELGLPLLPDNDPRDPERALGGARPRHAVSIEAARGVSTGISAADRARTIAAAIDGSFGADAVATPGHVFPLVARPGGVLTRPGGTEAAVDLARLAGLNPSGVLSEILRDDGEVAVLADVGAFAARHALKVGSVADLLLYRVAHDRTVVRQGETAFDSRFGGRWRARSYRNEADGAEYLLLLHGSLPAAGAVPVHLHRIGVLADLLGASAAPGPVAAAMAKIAHAGAGAVVLVRPRALLEPPPETNAGSDLGALASADLGALAPADLGACAQILVDAEIRNCTPLTGADAGLLAGLAQFGIATPAGDATA